MTRPRIGIYGGTFDPPHLGHLQVARSAQRMLQLARIEWVVGHVPPHRAAPRADPFDRFAMTVLATQDEASFLASARELRRGGVSFMVDTLRELASEEPGAELALIIGADSYDELDSWHQPEEIRRLAHLIVLPRVGWQGPSAQRAKLGERVTLLEMSLAPQRARDIRAQLSRGEPVAEQLDPRVERYIRARGLYRTPLEGNSP